MSMKTDWYSGKPPFVGAKQYYFDLRSGAYLGGFVHKCIIQYDTPQREDFTELWITFDTAEELQAMMSYLATLVGKPYTKNLRSAIRKEYERLYA